MDTDKLWNSDSVPKGSLWNPKTNLRRPRILTRLQDFIKISKKYEKLVYLRTMAEQILEKLEVYWPNTKPMDVYPAFTTLN